MKLITNANLELIIKEFYELLQEEFKPKQLEQARILTIGETGKEFDGSQNVFWSLNEIGAAHKDDVGSISNLTTSNKSSVVAAINELQNNKATIAYVNDAISNVEIEDVVTASEFIGNIENIENDYVTQDELEDALANLDDIDIEGMVTAVDVGNVDIEQGGGNNGGSLDLSSITMYDIKAYVDNETATVGSEIDALWSGYNELFQSANNGKELIASAIGEPLNADDTFSAMSNDINSLLSTFKTNMMNNGITVNSSDKFKSLIDKIAALADSEGKGIQYASGTATHVKSYLLFNGNDEGYTLRYDKLPFTPTIMFINLGDLYNTSSYSGIGGDSGNYYAVTKNLLGNNIILFSENDIMIALGNFVESGVGLRITNITDSSCYIEPTDKDASISSAWCFKGPFTYYAIGVGEEDTTLRDSLASILQEEGVNVTEEDNMANLITKVDEKFDLLNSQKGYQLDYENGIGEVIVYSDPTSYEIPTTSNSDVMVSWTSTVKGSCLISFKGGGNNSGYAYININRNGKIHTSNMFDYPSPANSSQVFSYIYDIEVGDIIYVTGDRTNVDPAYDSPYVANFTISSKLAIPSSSSGTSPSVDMVLYDYANQIDPCNITTAPVVTQSDSRYLNNLKREVSTQYGGLHLGLTPLGANTGLTLEIGVPLMIDLGIPATSINQYSTCTLTFKAPYYTTVEFTFGFLNSNYTTFNETTYVGQTSNYNISRTVTFDIANKYSSSSGNLIMYLTVIATQNYPNYNIIEKITFQ